MNRKIELNTLIGKKIKVYATDNIILMGICNGFTGKLDTEDELFDEITLETDKYKYVGLSEQEIEKIEILD